MKVDAAGWDRVNPAKLSLHFAASSQLTHWAPIQRPRRIAKGIVRKSHNHPASIPKRACKNPMDGQRDSTRENVLSRLRSLPCEETVIVR